MIVVGLIAVRVGAVGLVHIKRSADPDLDVDALFPCLLSISREEAKIEEVVDMLKV